MEHVGAPSARPWRERARDRVKRAIHRFLPGVPIPIRLEFGAWFLAGDDVCSDRIFAGRFEPAELRFVDRLLRPGMTVLDIGAHHGLYTLLASRRVGPTGRVIAFEPSARERRRLLQHLLLNRCQNVEVEAFALGAGDGVATLFRVDGRETGCSSLRPPATAEPTSTHQVTIRRLDDYLERRGGPTIDFVKLDVEGAELAVFQGAPRLLERRPRPIILCEVFDRRTAPWGHRARDVTDLVAGHGFVWHAVDADGRLVRAALGETVNADLVAVPEERLADVAGGGS